MCLSLSGPLVLLLLYLVMAVQGAAVRELTMGECDRYANNGLCEDNRYEDTMLRQCEQACHRQNRKLRLEKLGYTNATSFYNLTAKTLAGNVIHFEQFRGKVVVVTNVASYCGRTEQHYHELNQLYENFVDSGMFDILAFPCNQFGEQEPDPEEEIAEFCEDNNVEFRMMEKIHVNGPEAHDVYRYLKQKFGPARVTWNFGTYYLISPSGSVEVFNNVSPNDLSILVKKHIRTELASRR
jgi:glutathione peroxidase